ncbi:MAG: 23S rRNA (adenine(2503)-C(2))-methyltransferase RlmN [Eubacterium sp.]|nr:23S rRNA (adenine(2503)-C(2))-methyltransferase RlmN [Eubacterium sp.]
MKDQIRSYTYDEIRKYIEDIGEKGFRAGQLFEWVQAKRVSDFSEMTNLSVALRNRLDEDFLLDPLQIRRVQRASDGSTVKYLFGLSDGDAIESVWMRYRHGDSICVSSQAGCRMGCSFCASTMKGLNRSLTPAEMLSQVYDIEREIYDYGAYEEAFPGKSRDFNRDRVSSIIVMGMGEPFDNYDNVIRFIRLLVDEKGRNLSAREVTVSTCGLTDGIYRLMDEELPITLAISLHAPNDEIRSRIMPVAKAHPMDEIFEACKEYFHKTGRRITFEYSLMSGINDGDAHASELSEKMRALMKTGVRLHINLIPVNAVKGRKVERPDLRVISRFKKILEKNKINATIRREMGSEIDAACGQLRLSGDNP